MKAFCGILAALALLALGLYFLPAPETASTGGIFAALWLLAAAISAAAFGRELLLLLRLNRIRTRWRRAGKKLRRRPAVTASRFNHLRERERRLD
jgi:hypothetical protein